MTDTIAIRQNLRANLRHFAASRVWYRRAKWMAAWQAAIAIGVPLGAAYLLSAYTDPIVRSWTTALAITVSLLDVLVFEPAQKRWRAKGAGEQELFDCKVLALPWPDGLAGAEPTDIETVEATEKLAEKDPAFQKYQNWYPEVASLPPWLGTLVCQRCNAWWDASIRKFWAGLLWTAALTVLLVVVAAGIEHSYKVSDLILTIYAPVSPLILWIVKEQQKHRDAAQLSDRALALLEKKWKAALARQIEGDNEGGLREVQDAIYTRRRNSPLVPGWLHALQQRRYLKKMNKIVQRMCADAQASQIDAGRS